MIVLSSTKVVEVIFHVGRLPSFQNFQTVLSSSKVDLHTYVRKQVLLRPKIAQDGSPEFYLNTTKINTKQAGAELCQAQFKLGLAKLAVNRNKLRAYLLLV